MQRKAPAGFILSITFGSAWVASGMSPYSGTGVAIPFPGIADDDRAWLRPVGDLNGDGLDDFGVPVCSPARVDVMLSGPDGYAATSFDSGLVPAGLLFADVNSDGLDDMIVPGPLGQFVEFRYGTGAGGFGEAFRVQYSRSQVNSNCLRGVPLMVEDVDGDGRDELVMLGRFRLIPAGPLHQVLTVPLGKDGPGGMADATGGVPWTVTDFTARDVRLTDFDGDGDLDLFFLRNLNTARLCRWEDGRYQTEESFGPAAQDSDPALADLNGDGVPDVVWSEGVSNQSPSYQATRIRMALLSPDGSSSLRSVDIPSPEASTHWSPGDLDGDGMDDLVLEQSSLTVVVRSVLGTPDLTEMVRSIHPPLFAHILASEKFDMVQIQGAGVHLFPNGRTAEHLPMFLSECAPWIGGLHGLMLDADLDGRDELYLAQGLASSTKSYQMTDDGTLELIGRPLEYAHEQLAAGEFNGDGMPDLAGFGDAIDVALGRGDLSFDSPSGWWFGTAQTQFAATAGDVDGDGLDEIVVVRRETEPARVINYEDGAWTISDYPVDTLGTFGVLFDANGDGMLDMVVGNSVEPSTRVILNDGEGGLLQASELLIDGMEMHWGVSEDADGDGWDDLVLINDYLQNDGKSFVVVCWGGPGGVVAIDTVPTTGSHTQVTVADINADGLKDIITGTRVGRARVLLQGSDRMLTGPHNITTWEGIATVAAGDLNNDGHEDFFFSLKPNPPTIGYCRAFLYHTAPGDACPADMDGNGVLDFFDVSAFLERFAGQDGSVDLAAPFGVWDSADVAAFLEAYDAGCP